MNLQEAWKADQEERNYYHDNYLTRNTTWEEAAAKFRHDKNIPPNQPLFTDYTPYAMDYLRHTLPARLTEEDWNALWGLAQHADTHIEFQRHVLHLIQHQKGTYWKTNEKNQNSAHEYLNDRIAVNEGKEQQHGTQTGA
jgi:hypothetical protein